MTRLLLRRLPVLACLLPVGCMVPPPPPPPVMLTGTLLPATVAPSDPLDRLAALPGVAPPVMEPVGAAGAMVTRLTMGERVLFDSGSDQPLPGADAVLALVAEAAARMGPGTAVTVVGHTDAVGGDAYNMALAARRATSVLDGLRRNGVPPDALAAVAMGRRQPVASNATPEGRAANRRVEFLLGPGLDADLAAARSHGGTGEVPVRRGTGDGSVRDAGLLRLGDAPVARTPAPSGTTRVAPPAPRLRLSQPEAVHLAPLGPAMTY